MPSSSPASEQAPDSGDAEYPHGTHPGLVPGVAVDEQRVRYRTDKITFGVAGGLIVAFILWGAQAQAAAAGLPRPQDFVLATAHPSPLSARRGFFGSRPFSRVNGWLALNRPPVIDWTCGG